MVVISLAEVRSGYDVVIVGAGPAGCSVAKNLSQKYNVLLIDSVNLPRNKPCGGILVDAAKEFIQKYSPSDSIFVYPKLIDIKYVDFENNSENRSEKNFFNVDRQKFDYWLFSLIEDSSISVSDKTKLIDFSYTKSRDYFILVLESKGQIKTLITKYLVGCDGATSVVRQKISHREIPYYIAIQEELQNQSSDDAYFIFDGEITDFYSWIIPKNNSLFVGSALLPQDARFKFDMFKEKIGEKLGITGKGTISSALIRRPKSIKDIFLGKNNVLLTGEAAGLISPSSAEGISFALHSGLLCAEAINQNKNALVNYSNACKPLIKRIASKIKKSNLIMNPKKRIILSK